jgi:proteasome assembly chaperone (PAC2) family protein
MKLFFTTQSMRRTTGLILLPIVTLIFIHAAVIQNVPGPTFTQVMNNEMSAASVGGIIGGCGILVGIGVGLVGAALSGVTFGFGVALAISAGLHVSAVICTI